MENIRFENKYLLSKDIIKEYVDKILLKKLMKRSRILAIISIVFLIFLLYKQDYVIALIYAVPTLIILCVLIIMPPMTVNEVLNNSKSLHGGVVMEAIYRFGDSITLLEGSITMNVEYSQVKKIHELDKICVLLIGKSNGIVLKKDSFSVGEYDDFKVFISDKCKLSWEQG